MKTSYYCNQCNDDHDITSTEGIKHLRHNLSEQALLDFINLSTTIPTYEVITNGIPGVFEGTNEFVREVNIANVLQQKFPHMQKYHSADGLRDWLSDRMSDGHQSTANALSRIQGDAAGEVDFVRDMQGSIHNIFHKFDFVRSADGRITSNFPGIDAEEVNRFTGDVVNEFQVKTLRSVHSIDSTLKDFINNDHYNSHITLVGPKELIDRAHDMGLPNPSKVMGTIQDNFDSAHRLSEKILSEQLPLTFSPDAVLEVVDGTAIGAVVSITLSALVHYMQYRAGKITLDELKVKIAQSGVKGAVTGSTLAGLSLFIPGGLVGCGVAFVVGTTLRRLLDEGFGNGTFGELLKTTKAVHVNVQLLHHGSVYVAKVTEFNENLLARSNTTIEDMQADCNKANELYSKLESKYDNALRIDYSKSPDDILEECDAIQNKLRGASKQ